MDGEDSQPKADAIIARRIAQIDGQIHASSHSGDGTIHEETGGADSVILVEHEARDAKIRLDAGTEQGNMKFEETSLKVNESRDHVVELDVSTYLG